MQHPLLKKLKKLDIFDITSIQSINSEEAKTIEDNYIKNQVDWFTKNSKSSWEDYDINIQKLLKYYDEYDFTLSNWDSDYHIRLNHTASNYFNTKANTLFHLNKNDRKIIEKFQIAMIVSIGFGLWDYHKETENKYKNIKLDQIINKIKWLRVCLKELWKIISQDELNNQLSEIGVEFLITDNHLDEELNNLFNIRYAKEWLTELEKLKYYELIYNNDYNNLKVIPDSAISRYLLYSKKYDILYSKLSNDKLREKIMYDIWILNQVAFSKGQKIHKKIFLQEYIIKTHKPWSKEFINEIRDYRQLLLDSLNNIWDIEFETSFVMEKFHYYSMLYDTNVVNYYIRKNEIDEAVSWINKNILTKDKYFGEPYWIDNIPFQEKIKWNFSGITIMLIHWFYGISDLNQIYKTDEIYHIISELDKIGEKVKLINSINIQKLLFITESMLRLRFVSYKIHEFDVSIFRTLNVLFSWILQWADTLIIDNKLKRLNEWRYSEIENDDKFLEKEQERTKKMQEEIQKQESIRIEAQIKAKEREIEAEEQIILSELNKLEDLKREFKSWFCIKPDELILQNGKADGIKISKWWSFWWLEAIVEFLNTDGWDLYVWVWEIEAANKIPIDENNLNISHDLGVVYMDKRIPALIITWVDSDLEFENANTDLFTRKINDCIKKFILSNPFEAGDLINIQFLKLWTKTVCKIIVPKWKNYYHLRYEDNEKFLIRINNQKETLTGYKMSEYIRKNPR